MPSAKTDNNEYLQPFVVASLAAIAGFGYIYFYRGDVTRALTVGGVTFLVLFWVVLRGNNLNKQRQNKVSPQPLSHPSVASNRRGWWTKVAVACLILLALPVIIYFVVSAASDPANTNRSTQSNATQDDGIKRIRKIELHFWQELTANPHPSFADGVDAAVAALEIPVHNMEKNWPTGPTVVTYEGTAMDANKIYVAIRSAGVPVSGYKAIE